MYFPDIAEYSGNSSCGCVIDARLGVVRSLSRCLANQNADLTVVFNLCVRSVYYGVLVRWREG